GRPASDVAGAPPHVQARSPGRGDRGQPHAGRCSAKGTSTPKSPTSGEVHDTPESALLKAPLGTGVAWKLQFVPFHASASGTCWFPVLLSYEPVATQAAGPVHETPSSCDWTAPATGTGCRVPPVPFPDSAMATGLSWYDWFW